MQKGRIDSTGGGDDGIDIVDETDLGAVTAGEERLLAANVDLAEWEKRRVIAVLRLLKRKRYFEFLGVDRTATKRELKRAYYRLSKEFHPDRYYNRQLGPYKALLNHIFKITAELVRQLYAASRGPGGPRRRFADRFQLTTRVRLLCRAWPEAVDGDTVDVSEGGMFVATDSVAARGTRLTLRLQLPNRGLLQLRGVVAWSRPFDQANEAQLVPGVGIAFEQLSASERARFALLLEAARNGTPMPVEAETDADSTDGARRRLARGSRPIARPTSIIGIDLGTTFTSVSAACGNSVRVLPWPDGEKAIPSMVCFPQRGHHVVGPKARARLAGDPAHVVPAAKRLLGRRADEPEIEAHLAQAGYHADVTATGEVMLEMWGEHYAVPQLCSYLLRAARENAERVLGHAIDRAVLTAPVTFDARRTELLKRSAELAQIEVVEVIDEPSAAALANRYQGDFGGIIGVYDFGGGTFDFSLVDASAGDFRVLDTAGDGWLGGDDFDLAMASAIADKLYRVHGINLRGRAVEWQALLTACENAKRTLSLADSAFLVVPAVARSSAGPRDLRMNLRRVTAEALWENPIRRSIDTCNAALHRLGLQPEQMSGIYLSGGTSYIPAVQRALQQCYRVPVRIGVPPEYAAVLGAGIHAAQLDLTRCATLAGR